MTALEYQGGQWTLFRYTTDIADALESYLDDLEADQYVFPETGKRKEKGPL